MSKIYCAKCKSLMYFWYYAKRLLDYTNSFYPDDYEKNCKVIYNYFTLLYKYDRRMQSLGFRLKKDENKLFLRTNK